MLRTFIGFVVGFHVIASAAFAEGWFTLADYNALEQKDQATARLVLKAMREAIFYGQESMGTQVVCASPIPISDERLKELLDAELASPTNSLGHVYTSTDQLAFVLVHALRAEGACK